MYKHCLLPFASHILGGGGFWPCLIYSLVELAAGGAAAGVFMLTQPSEYEDLKTDADMA